MDTYELMYLAIVHKKRHYNVSGILCQNNIIYASAFM